MVLYRWYPQENEDEHKHHRDHEHKHHRNHEHRHHRDHNHEHELPKNVACPMSGVRIR
jgi:hypothetical protein